MNNISIELKFEHYTFYVTAEYIINQGGIFIENRTYSNSVPYNVNEQDFYHTFNIFKAKLENGEFDEKIRNAICNKRHISFEEDHDSYFILKVIAALTTVTVLLLIFR